MLVEAAAAVSELLEMVLEQPIDKLGRKLARRKVEKCPGLCQKSSTFYQKRPIVNEESSLEMPIDKLGRKLARCTVSACSVALVLVYQKSPTLYQKSHTVCQKSPTVNEESPLEQPIDKLERKLARCKESPFDVPFWFLVWVILDATG